MERAAFLFGAVSIAAIASPATSLTELERRYGGRLGVAVVQSGTGERIVHRADERFPMCSTFKMLLVAAVLSRADAGNERLERHVAYSSADLLDYAPITRANIGRGAMTVEALCKAAIEYSDNTAANVLLRSIGGPHSVTAFARSLGDRETRLDRNEPSLNTALTGDERDTTTPAAMVASMQRLLVGRALSRRSQRQLQSWLLGCTTGLTSIRAGVPRGWRVGDKTGSGAHATVNDIAVLYPPGRSQIFVTAYYTGSSASRDTRYHVLAEVGRIVSTTFT